MLRTMTSGAAPVTGEWECMECGYIEEGVRPRRPKACPECGAPANAMEFFPYEPHEEADGADWVADDLDAEGSTHDTEGDYY